MSMSLPQTKTKQSTSLEACTQTVLDPVQTLDQLHETNMLPEGTEVYVNGMYGRVAFSCEQYMTVCVRKFPKEPVRDVCILIYPEHQHKIQLVHGNHSHDS